MVVDIYLQNTDAEKLKDLGIAPENDGPGELVEFHFPDSAFTGYWVDKKENCIVFYVGGHTYSTYISRINIERFNSLINKLVNNGRQQESGIS